MTRLQKALLGLDKDYQSRTQSRQTRKSPKEIAVDLMLSILTSDYGVYYYCENEEMKRIDLKKLKLK